MTDPTLFNTFATALSLSLACAILSVIVVLRRWAFIGEGIAHSGFGGAGTAWLLMLAFPALESDGLTYSAVVVFCLITALAIGALSQPAGAFNTYASLGTDSAIGIFMVASLAWGFLAQQIFYAQRHAMPSLFENLLFGQIVTLSPQYARLAIAICISVVAVLIALWKEILAYSFDPLLAQASGVRSRAIHYGLMLLIGAVIVIGVRIVGSVLVTALLVLPGATALLLSRSITRVVAISIIVTLIGIAGGFALHGARGYLPAGPAMVLVLFAEFIGAYIASRRFQQAM